MKLCSLLSVLMFVVTLRAAAQEGPPEGAMDNIRPIHGTISAISGGAITIKTDEGETWKVLTGPNTRLMKDREPAKASDLHIGDTLVAGGELDPKAHTVGAIFAAVLDPEQTKRMREDLGKTWTAGQVTAIQELNITLKRIDGATQTFTVDENTSFKKHRESITLADIKVGDNLGARGSLKDGAFLATDVTVGRAGAPGAGIFGPGAGTPHPPQR